MDDEKLISNARRMFINHVQRIPTVICLQSIVVDFIVTDRKCYGYTHRVRMCRLKSSHSINYHSCLFAGIVARHVYTYSPGEDSSH